MFLPGWYGTWMDTWPLSVLYVELQYNVSKQNIQTPSLRYFELPGDLHIQVDPATALLPYQEPSIGGRLYQAFRISQVTLPGSQLPCFPTEFPPCYLIRFHVQFKYKESPLSM